LLFTLKHSQQNTCKRALYVGTYVQWRPSTKHNVYNNFFVVCVSKKGTETLTWIINVEYDPEKSGEKKL
jgi:hypothetical protein